MADGQHGGYRRPGNPAPTSGPGALSARTDGGASQPVRVAPGGEYGSRQEMEQIQAGSPMQGGGGPMQGGGGAPTPGPTPVPLDAPTQNPGEPVTAGADAGAGIGAAAAGITSVGTTEIDDNTRKRLIGALPTLLWLASQPKASEQTRQFVRQLRGDL